MSNEPPLNSDDAQPSSGKGRERSGPDAKAHRWLRRYQQREATASRRTLWVGGVLLAVMSLLLVALLARAAQLQTNPPKSIAQRVNDQQTRQKLIARRGLLRDRRGRVLAGSRLAQRLFADPLLIQERGTFDERVAYNLGYQPFTIDKKLRGRSRDRYVVLDRRMTDEKYHQFQKLDIAGLATKPIVVRDYPQADLAGPVLGFVGTDGHGLEGLEAVYDDQLIGEPGEYALMRDARRRAMWIREESYRPPTPGRDVRLSLDAVIQQIAEKHLGKVVDHHRADSGMLVVMNPRTGEIVAMASEPDYNPNRFNEAPASHRRNRCVTDVFEPGSIYKPIVWSGLTELNIAQPEEMIDCSEQGYWVTDFGRTLHDAHGMGAITWNKVLVDSSNIGMAKVALRTDNEKLHHMVQSFGFGQTTGSGLPGEVKGLVRPLNKWNEYSQTSIPMGQEIGTTALQMVRAFSVFANGGLLLKPAIQPVDALHEREIAHRVLPEATADRTLNVLRRVVADGTGRKAQSERYRFFGKTGTAQLPNRESGGYYASRYMSSFVGGGPVDEPRLVAGCFVRDPDPAVEHYGGLVSAPVVKKVLEESLQYLGVPPKTPEEDEDNQQVAME